MLFPIVSFGQRYDEYYYELKDFEIVWKKDIFDSNRKEETPPVKIAVKPVEPVRYTFGLTGVIIADEFPAAAWFQTTDGENYELLEGESFGEVDEDLFLMKILVDHVVFSCNGEDIPLDFNHLLSTTGGKNEKWIEKPGGLNIPINRISLSSKGSNNRQNTRRNNTRNQGGNQILNQTMQYVRYLSQKDLSKEEFEAGVQGALNKIQNTTAGPARGRGGRRGGQRGGG
jgi:type II secretory pathway component PulC